jgi:hypothetical protein
MVYMERYWYKITTNPKSSGGLLPSHGGERYGGVGEGGEAARDNSGSGSPSNLPLTVAFIPICFSIFNLCSVHRKINHRGYIKVFLGQTKAWHKVWWKLSSKGEKSLYHVKGHLSLSTFLIYNDMTMLCVNWYLKCMHSGYVHRWRGLHA